MTSNPIDTGGFAQQFVSGLTDVDTVQKDILGVIRRELNGVYKYVQFGASRTTNVSGALAAGDVACYVVGTTADLDKMTLVDEPNSAVGAGVVCATIAATGGPYYGWLQVSGVATLSTAPGGSAAAGNALTTSSASAKATTKRANEADQTVGVLVDATNFVAMLNFPW